MPQFVVMARRLRADDLRHGLMVVSAPHMTERGRRATRELIDGIARVGQVRLTTFEMLPDDAARVGWIGQALKLHGEKWAEKHPQYLRWLQGQGVSREEAIRRHEEWHAAEMNDPFWSKPVVKPVSRRKARRRARRGQ